MRQSLLAMLLVMSVFLLACGSGENTGKISVDETGFNPKIFYGKTRADIAKMHPNISHIREDMSSGPFTLSNTYGVQLVTFVFEDSWLDGLIRSVNLTWKNGVNITTAAKKFDVDLSGITPNKTPRYWEYPINKDGIKFFKVNLSTDDTEESTLRTAWVVYAN